MRLTYLRSLLLCTLSFFSFSLFAQHAASCSHEHDHSAGQSAALSFIENQNQWHPNIAYSCDLGGLSRVYLEEQAFTYVLYAKKETDELHDIIKAPQEIQDQHRIPGHAYKVHFVDALTPAFSGHDQRSGYNNYFLGNDPTKWASNVPVYHKVIYDNIYPDIQLAAYSQGGNFKYDFIVAPHADPTQIGLQYEGVDGLQLHDGNLVLRTSVGEITELKPFAYQMIDGQQQVVPCHYELNQSTIRFYFPNGYDSQLPLVIDPTVVGATLSGSTGTNYGHTATFDNAGNIYAGGIVFGTGYPTTMGAFQENASGGIEMGISKYSPDASDLEYATYIGGTQNDYPHSLIVDYNGQLCVYGSSRSDDYPTSPNAVQTVFGGDTDIVITKLNADGSAMVGSTYMGGADSDGQNLSNLNSNYGDTYRGEIVLDNQGNIYIASCTSSDDFMVTPNAYQTTYNSSGFTPQDGVVCKLNSDLSTLYWSTYLGGDNADICLGLRVDDFDEVYVTGYAGSDNFPMIPGGVQETWPGGAESAFVLKLSEDGSAITKGTYWGTGGDEHSFFIDIDEEDQVHIYGTTTGDMEITPGAYSYNSGSNQFLAAFNGELNTLIYSTVIGTGGNENDFVPVAFMVDKCNGIYFSGYQSAEGLPVTPDAFETGGFVFYLGVLEPNATALSFGSYYGNAYHVDGGTSRFDKAGRVYQAVCSGSFSQLNTTPDAFAPDQIGSWDVGVFKIDFEIETITASAFASPSTSGCAPFTVDFTYTGENAQTIEWDFGTGDGSTEFDPTYTFTEPGTYTVMQIVNAPNTCNQVDTFFLQIDVLSDNSTLTETAFCQGSVDLFLDVSTANATYEWQDGTTGATYQVYVEGIYWVDVNIDGCTRRDSFVVISQSLAAVDLGEDQGFCDVDEYLLDAQNPGTVSYLWQDGSTDSTLTVTETGEYWVLLVDEFGCEATDTVNVIFEDPPTLDLGDDINVCEGSEFTLDATTSNATYLWQDGSTDPTFTSDQPGTYSVVVDVFGCTTEDEITVTVNEPSLSLNLGEDQTFCDMAEFVLDATNSNVDTYEWQDGSTGPTFTATESGEYWVMILDEFGCEYADTVSLDFGQSPVIDLGADITICEGEQFMFDATVANATYEWQDGSTDPTYSGDQAGLYTVTVDLFGCVSEDEVLVDVITVPLDLDDQGTACDVPSLLINATAESAIDYMWETGDTSETILVTSSGTYSVSVVDAFGCEAIDSIEVVVDNSLPMLDINLVPEASVTVGDDYVIDLTLANIAEPYDDYTFEWTPSEGLSCSDCQNPTILNPESEIVYMVTVTNKYGPDCNETAEIRITPILDCEKTFDIPNAFTPDADGNNDYFSIVTEGLRDVQSFEIYNRWGEKVYENEGLDAFWDGTIKGKPAPSDVYIYMIRVECPDLTEEVLYGDVTLIR